MSDASLPDSLTLDQAFRAAYFMVEQYVALEGEPDVGLILFEQYLHSDPARWKDWKSAVGRAIAEDASTDPLSENLDRDG
ncbi:MAG: hypothetical protein JWP48_6426 [Actinoallomurus sp.]|jgi:hypothetical protein|nr:hypothetical protein [Actinoallomurus sp.]